MALPRTGDVIAGKYRVERVLGQGGMGVVLAAHNQLLDVPIAIKVLHEHALGDASLRKRFQREARAAARLQSDHVARVLDAGELDGGQPYIAMEFLHGTDLADEVSRGPLAVHTAADAVLEACDAIAEAHSLGIVHRDLKPANLFRAQLSGGEHRIKVLDFGISKRVDFATAASTEGKPLTAAAQLLGSPLYMSPEQLTDATHVDYRTDVWACGVILFELLVGRGPFSEATLAQVCVAILERPCPHVRAFRPDVPEALARVIFRCLEKTPDLRYPSIGALVTDLAPFGSAHSARAAERARRFTPAPIGIVADASDASRAPPGSSAAGSAAFGPRSDAAPPASSMASAHTPPLPGHTQAGWNSDVSKRSSPGSWVVRGIVLTAALAIGGYAAFRVTSRGAGHAPSASASASAASPVDAATAVRPTAQAAAPTSTDEVARGPAASASESVAPPEVPSSRPASTPRPRSGAGPSSGPKQRPQRPDFTNPD
jgi:eukaryotic-like serine/threonine-protein kinase